GPAQGAGRGVGPRRRGGATPARSAASLPALAAASFLADQPQGRPATFQFPSQETVMTTESIEVSTYIEAPVRTVFAFFADPAKFAQWFEHGSTIVPGRGGRIELKSPMAPPASGPIEVWEENRRIVFGFGHPEGSGMLPPASSTVTVTFSEERGGTRVTIRHAGIADGRMRAGAGGGWQAGIG